MTFWYRFFKAALMRPMVKWWFRVKIEGVEKIPSGGCILAADHLDAADPVCLPALIEPPVTFPAKNELFKGKGIAGHIVSWFLKAVGQAPMDRSGGRASVAGLDSIQHILDQQGVVGIFPEGTRSPDGQLYKGHTGVARLALTGGKPVVPVGIINTRRVKSMIGIPTMKGARIVIGDPLGFAEYKDRSDDAQVLRWVTNEVMAAIQQLTGQSYVDVYASRRKRGDLSDEQLAEYVLSHPNQSRTKPAAMVKPTDEASAGQPLPKK